MTRKATTNNATGIGGTMLEYDELMTPEVYDTYKRACWSEFLLEFFFGFSWAQTAFEL